MAEPVSKDVGEVGAHAELETTASMSGHLGEVGITSKVVQRNKSAREEAGVRDGSLKMLASLSGRDIASVDAPMGWKQGRAGER